jgi:hypothetical protein
MMLDKLLAERVRFELTVQHNCTPDFESGAFDHSATFPDWVSAFSRLLLRGQNYSKPAEKRKSFFRPT